MEVKCIKNNGTLARVWRQRCSCCHNCSEHNNRNCPVSGKITPEYVAGSSWGSVCVPAGRVCGASSGSGRGSGVSGGGSRRLPTSVSLRASNDRSRVLRTPQAKLANNEFPTRTENVTECCVKKLAADVPQNVSHITKHYYKISFSRWLDQVHLASRIPPVGLCRQTCSLTWPRDCSGKTTSPATRLWLWFSPENGTLNDVTIMSSLVLYYSSGGTNTKCALNYS